MKQLKKHNLPELSKLCNPLTPDVLGLKFRVHPKRGVYQYKHSNMSNEWNDLSQLGLTQLIIEQKKKLKAVMSASVRKELGRIALMAYDDDFRANFNGKKALEYAENRVLLILARETA